MSNEKTLSKKEIFDEKIKPLHEQIFALCQEHNISMISSFSLSTKDDKKFTQALSLFNTNKEDPAAGRYDAALRVLQRDPSPAMGVMAMMAALATGLGDDCDCDACTERRKAEAEQEPECTCSKESKQEAETEKADK